MAFFRSAAARFRFRSDKDDIRHHPPFSIPFKIAPGKLLSFNNGLSYIMVSGLLEKCVGSGELSPTAFCFSLQKQGSHLFFWCKKRNRYIALQTADAPSFNCTFEAILTARNRRRRGTQMHCF